ncbi:MAG: ATP-binding protein [Kofleriaceae bacterium]
MNEVSCKVLELFMRGLDAKGLPHDIMIQGTSLTLERLRNKKERIDWPDLVAVLKNLRHHFSDEEFRELGRSHLRSPGLTFVMTVARLMFSPMDFYRWFNKPREGVGNQLFTCIVPTHREPAPNEIELDLTLPEGFEVSWEFYVITSGNFEELPALLGLPRATVTLSRIPRGGRFNIKVPDRVPFVRRIWRVLMWPFVARAAARELKEAHETLRERFDELEDARTKLDRQATQLRTAHAVAELIQRDLDLVRTLETVTKALVNEAGFASAAIHAITKDGTKHSADFGPASSEPTLTRPLTGGAGDPIGELTVVPQAGSDRTEREALLEFIIPTVSMALQNALSYRELEQYRAGLEKIVEQRTAELRTASDQLAGTVVQLREAQGVREKFFGNISHEIRTPLALNLLAATDIDVRAGSALDDLARSSLGTITDAARKLVRLVDELLLLAAGQEGKLKIHPEPTELSALIVQLGAAQRLPAQAAGHTIKVSTPRSLVANVDPVAIERIATNLVTNAIKYTPHGGTIEVELASEPEGIRLSVLDNGPGISEELAGRLFGRFERAQGEERRTKGTGLGLSLVKQLVEAHKGTVSAVARTGPGVELRVMLPSTALVREPVIGHGPVARLKLGNEAMPEKVTITNGARLLPPGISAGTILLAEDDPQLAEMAARLLAERYTVIVGLDGIAALELAKQFQPQLLVTDVEMPGMNGIELSREFREVTGDRLAPIIILSAVLDLGTRIAGLEAGAVDYVTKPFDPRELRARVDSQFRMRDLAIRLQRAEQLSALGMLTAGLAHELRNPANGIVNAVDPLARLLPAEATKPNAPVAALLGVVKSCAEQIGFLTRQLLSFRDRGDGGFSLDLRLAQLSDLVHRAIELAGPALEGVDVRAELGVEQAVMCAPPLLTQVLTNLIHNAGQAAGRGGWVEVRASSAEGKLLVEVSDSGAGVPLALRERVFEPFFTTKAPGAGTGLGLPLARTIVHRHGGVLEIREHAGRSAFVVELPMVHAEPTLRPQSLGVSPHA